MANEDPKKIIDLDRLTRYHEQVKPIKTQVGVLDRAISPYSKSNPLPLTHNLATGQILAMEGDMVVLKSQAGWGITRIDREEFGGLGLASGDTLLLPMAHFDQEGKPTDNLMLVGAVLFAAEEAVKGQSGEVLYTRRTSLFRATDNAIATWGGVKKWLAIADNESLLICHPLDITSATITRNGNDAANAAADLNQRRRIEEKLNLGGKDPRAWVGMADQLAPSEKTEQAAYRDEVLPAGRILGFAPELGPSGAGTRDGQIADSVSPVMREVSGVSGGANQLVPENGGSVNLEASTTSTRKPYLHMSNGTAEIIRVDAAETRSFSKGDIVVDVRKAMPSLNTFLNTLTIAPEQVAHKLGFLALQRD